MSHFWYDFLWKLLWKWYQSGFTFINYTRIQKTSRDWASIIKNSFYIIIIGCTIIKASWLKREAASKVITGTMISLTYFTFDVFVVFHNMKNTSQITSSRLNAAYTSIIFYGYIHLSISLRSLNSLYVQVTGGFLFFTPSRQHCFITVTRAQAEEERRDRPSTLCLLRLAPVEQVKVSVKLRGYQSYCDS